MTTTLKLDWDAGRIVAVVSALQAACNTGIMHPEQVTEITAALDDINSYREAAEAVKTGREPVSVLDPATGLVLFRGEIAGRSPFVFWNRVRPYTVIDLPPAYKVIPDKTGT